MIKSVLNQIVQGDESHVLHVTYTIGHSSMDHNTDEQLYDFLLQNDPQSRSIPITPHQWLILFLHALTVFQVMQMKH